MAQIKKAIVVVLAMAILFSLSVALSACGNDSELKWSYELNEDGKSYTALSDRKYDFDGEAYRKYVEKHPDDFRAHENKRTELYEKASKNCNKVTKASIPAEYKGLPITKISDLAIFPNLKTITVSEKSEHFAAIDNVLYSKNIDTVYFALRTLSGEFTLPDSVTSIGDSAFKVCADLTSITIPNSVTSIDYFAFLGSGLRNIYYTGDIASWCGISGLNTLMSESRTLYIDGNKVEGDLIIPDSVTSIGDSAFRGCTGLTSITIPNSVTSIGAWAFRYCDSLTSIEYDGTIEQWQAIQFVSRWNEGTGEYVVNCTDGTVTKDGTVTIK